jgi:hypothetical protein
MMSLPFQAGFAPDRWKKVTDIMLQNKIGDSRCHCLRIIALFESDFNHAKRILIGRKLLHHMEDKNMLPNIQFGSRPGRRCLSAVLCKVLSHDQIWLMRLSAAFIENDAVGCYDRLVNNLVLLILQKLGIPMTATKCLGELWDTTIHLIKTIFGTSDITYTSTKDMPLFGPGQGSTCGPLFWLLVYWLISLWCARSGCTCGPYTPTHKSWTNPFFQRLMQILTPESNSTQNFTSGYSLAGGCSVFVNH